MTSVTDAFERLRRCVTSGAATPTLERALHCFEQVARENIDPSAGLVLADDLLAFEAMPSETQSLIVLTRQLTLETRAGEHHQTFAISVVLEYPPGAVGGPGQIWAQQDATAAFVQRISSTRGYQDLRRQPPRGLDVVAEPV
jgi:hypothetical protein